MVSPKYLLVVCLALGACTSGSTTTTAAATTEKTVPGTPPTTPGPVIGGEGAPTAPIEIGSLPGLLATHDHNPSVYTPTGELQFELAEASTSPQPTWAADGSLAWTAVNGDQPSVRIRSVQGTTRDVIPPLFPFYYHWSPDSASLAMLGNGSAGMVELVVLREDTTALFDSGTPYFFDWSPNSQSIVAHVSGNRLRVFPITTTDDPFERPAAFEFGAPQWTSDGIAWVGEDAGALSAAIATVQTPDALVVGDPTTDETRQITRIDRGSNFSASGSRFAVQDGIPIGILSVFDGESTVSVGRNVIAYQWSPDGSALAWLEFFDSDGTARWSVWTADWTITFDAYTPSNEFASTYLPFWDQYIRSQTMWSPDSRAFAYGARNGNGAEIFVQPVTAGAEPVAVAPGGFVSWSPVSFEP